jgi:hypothetical protein
VEGSERQHHGRADLVVVPTRDPALGEGVPREGGQVGDREVADCGAAEQVAERPGVRLIVPATSVHWREGGEVVAAVTLRCAGELVGDPPPGG